MDFVPSVIPVLSRPARMQESTDYFPFSEPEPVKMRTGMVEKNRCLSADGGSRV